ncbi:hypothetical protein QUC31_004708 [Theobroma cacao]|uniref:Tetratricopeptide repeat-like superfamily protein, putative n=1 Tax=Theobroma cacao TaxID=3641 RepID=A0A061DRV2_THECC|nr:Tetratricopeptide repeat-like superfamily protein, putative [Theobroma cacao]
MVKLGIPTLFLFTIFLVALPKTLSQLPRSIPPPRPLCATQFALVNYACARVSFFPLPPRTPPPPPPSPPSPEGQKHEHRHGHRHRHRHVPHETPDLHNCCRWLKEVDHECVCEVLVHLPVFLSRPNHDYTVIVDETCSHTFTCGGRIIRP